MIHLGHGLAPDHPGAVHILAAAQKIKQATNGEVKVLVFPSSQLGDDTHMLANLRSGAMQMMAIGDNILATLVPNAAIDNIGFAFKDAGDGVEGAGRRGRRHRARRHRQGRPASRCTDLGRGLPPDHLQHQADQYAR